MKNLKLEKLLKERNLTRGDLVFLARTSPTLIRAIEKFNYEPRPEVAKRIADVLKVSISEIWGQEPTQVRLSRGDR